MRELYTIRLEEKTLLSREAECYHLEFVLEAEASLVFLPGQFFSLLAEDQTGKTYTRAYSIASAPDQMAPGHLALCVNRVQDGFFSNLLCDLEEGASLRCHGPHGSFTLAQPLVPSLMVAGGTGIAPIRGFLQWLFPEGGPTRNEGKEFWLIYAAPSADQLFYHAEFAELATRHADFHFHAVLAASPAGAILEQVVTQASAACRQATDHPGGAGLAGASSFAEYAYVCGLAELVKPVRAHLLTLGWEKRQILFERFD